MFYNKTSNNKSKIDLLFLPKKAGLNGSDLVKLKIKNNKNTIFCSDLKPNKIDLVLNIIFIFNVFSRALKNTRNVREIIINKTSIRSKKNEK